MAAVVESKTYEGGLLPPGAPGRRVRALVAWSARQRECAQDHVLAAYRAWLADWCLAEPEGGAQTLDADSALATFGKHVRGVRAPTPTQGAGVLAEAVAASAWNDWVERVQAITGGHFAVDAPAARSPWDGRLDVTLPWWEGTWALQLTADSIRELVATQSAPVARRCVAAPLTPVASALSSRLVELRAHFSPLTLTLGELGSLRVGDVIPLDQGLNEPVRVMLQPGHDAPGVELCAAWLGQQRGRLAAELAAHSN